MENQIKITSIGIVYHTILQISSGHEKGRVGQPLVVQAEDIPDDLLAQIEAVALQAAKKYWGAKEAK